jgi:hypothetical protein
LEQQLLQETNRARTTDQARVEGKQEKSLSIWFAPVLTLVGVIAGGFITTGTNVWMANKNSDDRQNQSIVEYRRDKREKMYQDMLAQMNTMDITVDTVSTQVEEDAAMERISEGFTTPDASSRGAAHSRIISEAQNKWQPAYERLTAAVSNAELVSSRKVIEYSKGLVFGYRTEFVKATYGQLYPGGFPGMLPVPPPDLPPEFKGKSIEELRRGFIEAAKADLTLD